MRLRRWRGEWEEKAGIYMNINEDWSKHLTKPGLNIIIIRNF